MKRLKELQELRKQQELEEKRIASESLQELELEEMVKEIEITNSVSKNNVDINRLFAEAEKIEIELATSRKNLEEINLRNPAENYTGNQTNQANQNNNSEIYEHESNQQNIEDVYQPTARQLATNNNQGQSGDTHYKTESERAEEILESKRLEKSR